MKEELSRVIADARAREQELASANEALVPLRAALEGNEQLREWAKQDSDLNPVRDDPRVIGLLA